MNSGRKAIAKSQDEEDEVVHMTSGLQCVLHQWREVCGITSSHELDVADMRGDAATQRVRVAPNTLLRNCT